VSVDQYVSYDPAASVTEAINTRRSLRGFLPTEVTRETISEVLDCAARAPSGTNMQPWKTYVVTGDTRAQLCQAVCDAFDEKSDRYKGEVRYYPEKWFEPFISRRRKVGWDLYGLLGINKGEHEKMHAQHRRNFVFFDAPMGIMFTIHRDLATGSWLDYGMFLQNVMLLAREAGLHTCPQAAWPDYHEAIRTVLPLESNEVVVCGMAVGYADADRPENALVTNRESVENFNQFLD